LPRRLNHDACGLARLVGLALGHEIDPVVVVARPRGVPLAERVERRPRDREPAALFGGCRLQEEVAAIRNWNVERNGIRGSRDGPGSRGHFLALGVPGWESISP